MKRMPAVMAIVALTLPAQAAEIFSEKNMLWLVGEIAKGDADRFVQLLTPEITDVYVYPARNAHHDGLPLAPMTTPAMMERTI